MAASPKKNTTSKSSPERPATAIMVQPSSPRFPVTSPGAHRKIGIAVDLSDESAFAVKWAVHNYLRSGDTVILLHVRPTSVLYGADWGAIDLSLPEEDETQETQQKREEDFDSLTNKKINDLALPLVESEIPFKVHIVKDHDMKERLCLEVERLGLSAVIMGSRGFGAAKRIAKGRLGSVSDYCVHHCVCPVVVVRFPGERKEKNGGGRVEGQIGLDVDGEVLGPLVEEGEHELHDSTNKHSDTQKAL
ncbi:Universal stress protein A [Corchorus capsularis]|uniref:Universal stress protein A n=1 Tax=Corchorus capsularis TaxID=210143 RepID=A0A1R3I221_COCAP|nr:Universal stress protein A [Corchorus capsularis]